MLLVTELWHLLSHGSQNCDKRLLASPCLSVRMKQLGSHWANFHENSYLGFF